MIFSCMEISHWEVCAKFGDLDLIFKVTRFIYMIMVSMRYLEKKFEMMWASQNSVQVYCGKIQDKFAFCDLVSDLVFKVTVVLYVKTVTYH